MSAPRWRRHFDALLQGLSDLGYEHAWDILDAADFGVPQRRRRILVVASRVTTPVLPKPGNGHSRDSGLRSYITVRDAIGSLLPLSAGEADPGDPYHKARRVT
jgi:DNA (cytosine-5)-methyltransferase 1